MNNEMKTITRMKHTAQVLLIYTGGTIGMGQNPVTGALEPLDFNHLLSCIPELEQVGTNVDVYQFTPPIDSSDMSPRLWAQLVNIISERFERYDGFVILHGTDTMAYTASALSFMLENLTKPVILTGSQLPIGQLRTDGKENLVTSIEFASLRHPDGTAVVPEVCINFNFHYHNIHIPDFGKSMVPHTAMDPNVMVFSLFPGMQDNIVRHVLEVPQLRSIVMRSYGSGNAPQFPWIIKLLREASERGVIIVNISQCVVGNVEMGRYDTSYQLKDMGIVSGRDCTVEAAVTKLMYLQGRYADSHIIRSCMEDSIAGEMTI